MKVEKLRSKIHRARVTEADLEYEGSLTVGSDLLEVSDMAPYDRIQVVNVTNGERFETYIIEGDEGEICLNGAAARRGKVGDVIIIISYGYYDEDEEVDPTVVLLDEDNEVKLVK
ncbi:MAG: aspartate 1-decarboxylase [Halobacteria archaeon]|nr:aspartate 1-decarboxylase [Halobacteria archaeon]